MALYLIIISYGNNALHRDGTAATWLLISLTIVGGIILLGITISLVLGILCKDKTRPEDQDAEALLDEAVKRRREAAGGHERPNGAPSDKQNEAEPDEER